MKRIVVAAGALLLVGALVGGVRIALGAVAHVYAVDEVVAGLRQHPEAWVGRTVLIWGRAIRFRGPCGFRPQATTSTAATPCQQGALERLVPAQGRAGYGTVTFRRGFAAGGMGYGSSHVPRGFTAGRGGYGPFGFWRGLVVVHRPGAPALVLAPPSGLVAGLARLPVLGHLIPATLLERGAVYRIHLLDSATCTSQLCPQGELL